MSDASAPNDPYQMIRDAYAQGIERWAEAMEEIVGSEDFASASGRFLALYAQQQQSIRAASRAAAESMHIPTTEDLAQVASLVANVERKADEITDQAADLSSRLAAVEKRLAALAELATASEAVPARLESIERTLDELAGRPGAHAEPSPAPAPPERPAAKRKARASAADKPSAAKRSARASGSGRRRTSPADG